MTHSRWLCFLILSVLGFLAWWFWNGRAYDRDLEKDFEKETGMTWKQAEKHYKIEGWN